MIVNSQRILCTECDELYSHVIKFENVLFFIPAHETSYILWRVT